MRGSSNENITYLYEGMKGSTIRNQCSGNTLYPTNGVDLNTPSKYIYDIEWLNNCSVFMV